jgi:hypothetical protein
MESVILVSEDNAVKMKIMTFPEKAKSASKS